MKRSLFTLGAVLLPSICAANMLVYPMDVTIGTSQGSTASLRVYSKSESTQYVQVGIQRVVDPATPTEHETPAARIGDDAVVVSPAKFVLPAGGSRLVRVIALGAPKDEQLYRVYLQPVAAPPEAAADTAQPASGVKSAVSFNLIWAPLVHVLPRQGAPALTVSRDGVLSNTGNVRLGVIRAGACSSESEEASCIWRKVERSVYPGQTYRLEPTPPATAPAVWRVRFRAGDDRKPQQAVIPGDASVAPRAAGAQPEVPADTTDPSTGSDH